MAIFVVLLFAFASVSVASISGALASGPTAALNALAIDTLVCQDQAASAAKAPVFKPCGKRINGQAIACHFDTGLLIDMRVENLEPSKSVQILHRSGEPDLSLSWPHYRPPQLS